MSETAATSLRHRPRAGTMFVLYVALLGVVALVLVVAGPFDSGMKVGEEQFGESWPLNVSKGVLRCEAGGEVTFQKDGTTYSLNREPGDTGNMPVDGMMARNPDGSTMSLAPLVERGRAMCD